jgi:hypothetical protein
VNYDAIIEAVEAINILPVFKLCDFYTEADDIYGGTGSIADRMFHLFPVVRLGPETTNDLQPKATYEMILSLYRNPGGVSVRQDVTDMHFDVRMVSRALEQTAFVFVDSVEFNFTQGLNVATFRLRSIVRE